MPLTDTKIRNLRFEGKSTKHSDGGGLYLQLMPSGSKQWRMAFRFDNKQKTLYFDAYPAISLAQARQRRDNAKGQIAVGVLTAAGVRLWFLPPYSPDLNPIEQTFSKIKHWMRMAQKRTIEETWRHVGQLVGTITPKECANYLKNAGYASVKN